MSKYIKVEDAIRAFKEWLPISEAAEDIIADLPTIEVSEDCISRKWLKENAKVLGDYYENTVWAVPLSILENAPSVVPSCQKNRQVERAEGEWINKQEKYQMAECSNCKKVTMHEMWGDKLVYYDYCPNCGAKMKG